MAELPHPWGKYAQIQKKLNSRSVVDSHAWGLEAGLNRLCEDVDESIDEVGARRVISSASRRERYRATIAIPSENDNHDLEPMRALEIASDLRFIERKMKPSDMALLVRIANGDSYDIIALTLGLRPDAVRARVARARKVARALFSIPQPNEIAA